MTRRAELEEREVHRMSGPTCMTRKRPTAFAGVAKCLQGHRNLRLTEGMLKAAETTRAKSDAAIARAKR